jgi:ABC-type glycerol-3-phosphate transport system substrate-binding protein
MQSLPVAIRYLPIPESNALYEMAGTEMAAAVTEEEDPDQALKDMQAGATRIMRKGGYYNG